MHSIIFRVLLLSVAIALSGCSFNHPVAKDYASHLQKRYTTAVGLPTTPIVAEYTVDADTQKHRYEFRSATVGYAHLWIVEFGKILEQTLNAHYVQASFAKLDKKVAEGQSENLIEFHLDNYEFKNFQAHVTMKIKLSKKGVTVLDRSYRANGNVQTGKMIAAGPFAMKSATLESTKSAIDDILRQFISDIPPN